MSNRNDEFFVGYLPTPGTLRRALRRGAVVGFAGLIVVAAAIVAMQESPGTAKWDLSHEVARAGVVRASPYPSLVTYEGNRILLVGEGKVGAADRVSGFDGSRAQVRGYLLSRDGSSMLELASTPDAIQRVESAIAPRPTPVLGTPVTLQGEIVDSKCYLGAMKPGEGKTHKACAALCIKGGVPPMLIACDAAGSPVEYLLVDEAGDAPSGADLERILEFIADPITIEGRVVPDGDLPRFRANLNSIRRR